MRKALLVINSVAGAGLLTLIITVFAMLVLMFTGDNSGDVHRTGLFGALEFDAVERPDGVVDITAGLGNPVPIYIIFAILVLQLALVQIMFRRLKQRREYLLQRIADGADDLPAK
ncbi:hypothetical protein AB0B28_20315 [Glycomyces sp. NPDC046736]|uniref:hypothetical protein n=1 Tax=Glycomyces sp. NPDC046736 TaxID=3155615 RepID=UPI0033C800CA